MTTPDQSRVTWLLPVKNGMPYLPLTLASIVAQTYSNHQIIAWDNGSTDGTLEELRLWIPARVPGTVISDRPLRLGPSLAAMVDMADTDLCAVIHGDDINHPWRLQHQVEFLMAHPEVGVLGGQSDFIDENGNPINGWYFASDDATIRWRSHWMCHFMHSAVMFRRDIIVQAGNYRDCQPYEDMELWIRASRFTEFANLEEAVIQYRRSSTSQTGRTTDFKTIFRQGAEVNATMLFPSLGAEEAMAMWDATYPDMNITCVSAKFKHFAQLKNVAIGLARQLGKSDDYFQKTPFYADQVWHLRQRWLECHNLGFIRRFKRPLSSPAIGA